MIKLRLRGWSQDELVAKSKEMAASEKKVQSVQELAGIQRNSRGLRRPLWVIGQSTNDWTDVLCVSSRRGGTTLPIFSFREEVEVFLNSVDENKDGWGWQPKQTTPEELISVLLGYYSDVARVALDPLPICEDGGVMLKLVSMSWEHFVRMLLGEDEDGQASERRHSSRLADVGGIPEYPR